MRYLVVVDDDCPILSHVSPFWRAVETDERPEIGMRRAYRCRTGMSGQTHSDCGDCNRRKTLRVNEVEAYSDGRARALRLDPDFVRNPVL
jgi:hypothetical protein